MNPQVGEVKSNFGGFALPHIQMNLSNDLRSMGKYILIRHLNLLKTKILIEYYS